MTDHAREIDGHLLLRFVSDRGENVVRSCATGDERCDASQRCLLLRESRELIDQNPDENRDDYESDERDRVCLDVEGQAVVGR